MEEDLLKTDDLIYETVIDANAIPFGTEQIKSLHFHNEVNFYVQSALLFSMKPQN